MIAIIRMKAMKKSPQYTQIVFMMSNIFEKKHI